MEVDYMKIGSSYVNSVMIPSQTEYGFRWFSKPIPNSSTLSSSTSYQIPRPRQSEVILGAQFKANSSGKMTYNIRTSSTYLDYAPAANTGEYADSYLNVRDWFNENGITNTLYKYVGYALHVSRIAYTFYYIKMNSANTHLSIFDERNGNEINFFSKQHPSKTLYPGIKITSNNYSFLNPSLSTTKYASSSVSYTEVGSSGNSLKTYEDLYDGTITYFHKDNIVWRDITTYAITGLGSVFYDNDILLNCANQCNVLLVGRDRNGRYC